MMKSNKLIILAACLLLGLGGVFFCCAAKASDTTSSNEVNNNTEKNALNETNSKAEKKISMSIGQEVGEFAITGHQKIDAPGGYDGTLYTVKTNDGKMFKCEILEPSGFGKVMTFGMASGAGAMCTDFTKGSKDAGKTNKANCNALLKAAGKC